MLRLGAAALTSASNRRPSASVSACHWTPSAKPGPSIASTVPSAARAATFRPRPRRSTAWWWKELTATVPAPDQRGEARAGQDLDLVRDLAAGLALAVAREVLVQRPAAGDVERLAAAADAQQRHPALERRARERELEGVQRRLRRPQLLVPLGGAVGAGVQVRAAGEADAVEAGDQRLQVRHARGQHDRDRARALDPLHVGHPERHLGVVRLALTTQRRQPAGAQLRRRHTDQRPHVTPVIDHFADIRHGQMAKSQSQVPARGAHLSSISDVEPIRLHHVQAEPDAPA